jgi:Transposase, Mutator family
LRPDRAQDRQRLEQAAAVGTEEGQGRPPHAIYEAPSRAGAEAAFDRFLAKYGAKYDEAAACLSKDREALLTFYGFPAEHWEHVRSTDEIDKGFLFGGAMVPSHGRPRGEERGGGCELRRAA